jgi:integrase
VRGKPYDFTNVSPGVSVGYRRLAGTSGSWVLRCADGKGGAWTRRIGTADDHESADGEHVFDFWQACDKARTMAHGTSASAPATWESALTDYAADLSARRGNPANASHVRYHLTPTLLGRPVGSLTAIELKRWRNDLLTRGIKPATVVRMLKSAKASLNLAANHDPRIQNRDAWRIGLSGLVDTYSPINRVLADADVLRLVTEAYALDADFGLVVDVLASTGTRTSQACGLLVADLQADRADPRLMMPSSRKGKGRKQVTRKPVPIPSSLARKLKATAGKRSGTAPLLTRAGLAWDPRRQDLQNLFAETARRAGIEATAYSLRHSSIVRSLLAGTPTRVVASMHDTSTTILERVYSHFILDHADTVARRGLLDTMQPVAHNVVSLPPKAH